MSHKTTQLSRLHSLFKNLTTDIGHLERPLDRFDDLLKEIDGTLHIPKRAADDIKSIRTKLQVIESLVEAGAEIPIIGSSCHAVVSVLKPMVKTPKPHGMLGKAETILRDIDKDVLSELKELVTGLKSPVDDTRNAVDSIHVKAVFIEVQLAGLVKKHGHHVPKDIEECARGIADLIEKPINTLDDINDYVKDELGTLDDALQPVQSALGSVAHIFDTVDSVIQKISNKSVDHVLAELDKFVRKFVNSSKAYINAMASIFGFNPKAIAANVDKLENKIASFFTSALDNEVGKLKQQLQDGVSKVPGVDKLEASVNDAKQAFAKLEAEIAKMTASACAKTLNISQ